MAKKSANNFFNEKWIDFSGIGLCHFNLDGTILYINKPAFDAYNFKEIFSSTEDAVGKRITDYIPEYTALFDAVKKESVIRDYELLVKSPDGSEKWLLHDCIAGPSSDGGNAVHVIFRDLSSYKQKQKDLIDSKKYLTSIIDSIQDIVYRIDDEGNITFISDSIKRYGYSTDELIGESIVSLIHPEDIGKAKFRIDERRTGDRKTRDFELRLISKNQTEVPFEFRDMQLNAEQFFEISSEGIYDMGSAGNKKYLGTQGVARDITKRKMVERAKNLIEEKCASVLQSLSDGYYEIGPDGTILFINNSLSDILGYEPSEIIGKHFKSFVADDLGDIAVLKEIETMMNDNNRTPNSWNIKTKNGKIKTVEGSVSLVKDIAGNTVGIRGIVRDITENLKVAQELFRARKLEAIGILAGGIAHDYNNALTAIIGNISLAKMEIGDSNSELIEILSDAESASLKVKELTQRLSNFAKGGRPVKKLTPIVSIIQESAEGILHKFKGTFDFKFSSDLWDVEIDQIQIGQVFDHILANAMESMPSGGTITITADNVTVEKEESHHEISLQHGKYVLVTVKDEGPGIEEEDIYRIFDPYYTTKDMASGMGLAISYAIIKRHRGYIDVKSVQGEGAQFLIYLPVGS